MDVYADLLFLVNFCMDYISLIICARASGASLRRFRAVLGAALGGVYSVAALFLTSGVIGTVLAVLSWLMISVVAFYRRGDSILRTGKLAFIFLGAEAILGGVVSAVFNVLGRITSFGESYDEEKASAGGSAWLFVALGLGALLAYFLMYRIKKTKLDSAASIKIQLGGKEAVIPILLDSGNLLREPMSGRLCTVVSASDIEGILGREYALGMKDGSAFLSPDRAVKVFVVPARTVDGRTLLYGFLPDEAELLDDSGHVIKRIDTLITVRKDDGGEGKAILPEGLI